jgi:hypothetical protein
MNAKYLDYEADRYDAMKAQIEAERALSAFALGVAWLVACMSWIYVFTRIGLAWWGGLL